MDLIEGSIDLLQAFLQAVQSPEIFSYSSIMATLHIARHQQSLGSFGEEEVREGLRTGRFSAEDLVWRAGMDGWKPLGEMSPQWGLEMPPPLGIAPENPTPESLPSEQEPAWEHREKIGFFPAIFETVSAVLMRPAQTFTAMKHEGGLVNPLLYFVLLGSVTFAVSAFYQLAANWVNPDLLGSYGQHPPRMTVTIILLGLILLSPLLYLVSAFISSGVIHLSLKMMGGANRPFETTFRVICYAQASASVFSLIPLCGGIMTLLFASYAIIIGLKGAHGTETWRAMLALLMPGLLCGVLLLLGGMAVGVSMAELSKMKP